MRAGQEGRAALPHPRIYRVPPPPHPRREILLLVEVSAENTKIDHKDIYLQKWEMSRFVLRKRT